MLPLLAAVTAEHNSKTAFYVAAGVLVAWALTIGVVGVTQPNFPRSRGQARGVMLVSGVLMAATMASAVIVSS